MLVVTALGGSAPLPSADATPYPAEVLVGARAVATLAQEHSVVVAQGGHATAAQPGGQTESALEPALRNEMPGRKLALVGTGEIVRLVPVGPRYADTPDGRRWADELGWMVVQDGFGFRQALLSVAPIGVEQLANIRTLVDTGVLVVCAIAATAGGAPLQVPDVIIAGELSAAVLAEQIGADLLMFLIESARVRLEWGSGGAPRSRPTSVAALRRTWFAPGSIGAEVQAACRFAEATGRRAAIGGVTQAFDLLGGEYGIQVTA
ncbi:MAG: hypothetical protein ACHQ0J_12905 [Candidatus Dormibacterales bacterium]